MTVNVAESRGRVSQAAKAAGYFSLGDFAGDSGVGRPRLSNLNSGVPNPAFGYVYGAMGNLLEIPRRLSEATGELPESLYPDGIHYHPNCYNKAPLTSRELRDLTASLSVYSADSTRRGNDEALLWARHFILAPVEAISDQKKRKRLYAAGEVMIARFFTKHGLECRTNHSICALKAYLCDYYGYEVGDLSENTIDLFDWLPRDSMVPRGR